jgi:hypothetical protein
MATYDKDKAADAFLAGIEAASGRKRALDERLADIEEPLKIAIVRAKGPDIDLNLALLEVEVVEIEDLLEVTRLLATDLRALIKDKETLARLRLVLSTAARMLSDMRDDLARSSKRCDQLIEDSESGLKKSQQTEEAALRGLAQLQRWQRLDAESLARVLAQSRTILDQAHEAVATRDLKALERARAAFDRLPHRIQRGTLDGGRQRVERWRLATLGKGLGAEVDRGLSEEAQQLTVRLDAFEADVVRLEQMLGAIARLHIPEVDARKAAKVLGVGTEQAAALGRIIDLAAPAVLERSLDAFLRKQKSLLAGKAALALLRKAKLI